MSDMYVLEGVEVFVQMGLFLKMRYARVRTKASTPYEGMLARGCRR